MAGLGGLQVSGTGHLRASVAVGKDGFRTPWLAMARNGMPGGRHRRRSRSASAVTHRFRLRA